MKELVYNPNPEPITAPLFERHSFDEVELSQKYELICNGKEQLVYNTDSFH